MLTPCFTLDYAAPEILRRALGGGDEYDESCDLWSLGVILVSAPHPSFFSRPILLLPFFYFFFTYLFRFLEQNMYSQVVAMNFCVSPCPTCVFICYLICREKLQFTICRYEILSPPHTRAILWQYCLLLPSYSPLFFLSFLTPPFLPPFICIFSHLTFSPHINIALFKIWYLSCGISCGMFCGAKECVCFEKYASSSLVWPALRLARVLARYLLWGAKHLLNLL